MKVLEQEVLDFGYIDFVEAWGRGSNRFHDIDTSFVDDENEPVRIMDYERGIIEAARQSTQGNFRGWNLDRKLLAHLYNNKHSTPFEFAGMTVEVQAPIFVIREWERHRTQSYSEMSARYAPLPNMNYLPTVQRCIGDPTSKNKQAQGVTANKVVESLDAAAWRERLSLLYAQLESHYANGLAIGIPKEIARCSMSVAHYSRMRCSANLRNWLGFLTLRMDPNAQYEIRQFAHAVAKLVQHNFPETWKLFSAEIA